MTKRDLVKICNTDRTLDRAKVVIFELGKDGKATNCWEVAEIRKMPEYPEIFAICFEQIDHPNYG